MHYTGYGSRISCLNLTLLHEWCALNRLSNAYFDAKFKKTPLFNIILIPILQNFAVSLFYQRQNLQSERTVSTDCQIS
jgi:hypothetical protein